MLGLELCPFAGPVLRDGSLRIVVSEASAPEGQLQAFLSELDKLQSAAEDAISTTLLVLEKGPVDFAAFLDLLDDANRLIDEAGLRGHLQIAHFHPAYQFEGEPPDGLSHYTNRSPLPTLHLLRESALERVLASYPDPEGIPARNIARLEAMGRGAVESLWEGFRPGGC